MKVECECGNDKFGEPRHEYYAGQYVFTCPECGSPIKVYEKGQH